MHNTVLLPCTNMLIGDSCVLQTREEAQRAKDDLNGIMLHDNDLRIGWGKSIPIPAAPMFVLNPPGGVAPSRGAAIAPPGQTPGLAPWGSSVQPQQPTGICLVCKRSCNVLSAVQYSVCLHVCML